MQFAGSATMQIAGYNEALSYCDVDSPEGLLGAMRFEKSAAGY